MRHGPTFLVAAGLAIAICGPAAAASPSPARQVASSIALADIPAGQFVMGADPAAGFQNGFPPHRVNIRRFRMSRYDVTFAQYDAYARATGRPLPPDEGWGRDNRPVIHVSWNDAKAFIRWLNTGAHRRFRLPTEAEWEYAARGGTTTAYWWGDKPDQDKANIAGVKGKDRWPFTSPVGSFPANPFGLYDVLGNVWQLVEDCRLPDYQHAPRDGSAARTSMCVVHVARGGCYGSMTRGMQSAARGGAGADFESRSLGFRLAEDIAARAAGAHP